MKRFIPALGALAAVLTIVSFLIQVWPRPLPTINVLVERRDVGRLVIKAVTDEGRPIVNADVTIRPGSDASYSIRTHTNSQGELEIRAASLIDEDGPANWHPNSRFIVDASAIPVYVVVSKDGYKTGVMFASIDIRE